MKAVVSTAEGIENVKVLDMPDPAQPQGDEVLIAIKAIGLNQRDLINIEAYERWGRPDPIPGCDGAGEVVAVGPDVTKFKVGDKVITSDYAMWVDGPLTPEKEAKKLDLAYTCDGCMCELFKMHQDGIVRMPSNLTYEEAGVLSCTGVTAYNALFKAGGLEPGQTVLILGTGGVSILALKFAKAAGARVVITGINDEVLERAKACGADHCINFTTNPEWHKDVLAYTNGVGVDLTVDIIGPGTLNQSMMCTRQGGTISVAGFVSGLKGDVFVAMITQKLLRLQGFRVGSTADMERMVNLVELADIHPEIDSVYKLDEIQDAFKRLKSGLVFGKISVLMD